ncbi:hypothetical protein AMTR_s00170p00059090 [Amborella trichopoda]|uniref:Bromo domain-containing protein n=1 Tax=Amborella trichopoda TaxID=13333 RepID=W1NUL3_AMBTC|nr:hypothetical protein AMTR_s00170p00059090 [Amborella trichopoda]
MKRCGQILTKLMKHKHGWVFNVPVDVVGMGLHDYYTLVKNPMDLGNAKTRLNQSFYSTPLEFAADGMRKRGEGLLRRLTRIPFLVSFQYKNQQLRQKLKCRREEANPKAQRSRIHGCYPLE